MVVSELALYIGSSQEFLLMMTGRARLHYGDARLQVQSGDVVCNLLRDVEAHAF